MDKRAVELEKDKLQIDINYRENVVADERVTWQPWDLPCISLGAFCKHFGALC